MSAGETGETSIRDKIAMAEAAVAALADQFLEAARADAANLRALAEEARAKPGRNAREVRRIFEIAHNIKGQGGSFGFDLITEIGASLCLLTRDAVPLDEDALTVIDHHLRVLSVVIEKGIKGDGGELGMQLIAKLRALTLKPAA